MLITDQIFAFNNDTILRANNTFNYSSFALIFSPYYHNLLQMNEYIIHVWEEEKV